MRGTAWAATSRFFFNDVGYSSKKKKKLIGYTALPMKGIGLSTLLRGNAGYAVLSSPGGQGQGLERAPCPEGFGLHNRGSRVRVRPASASTTTVHAASGCALSALHLRKSA